MCADRSPPPQGAARSRLGPRGAPLRWTSQEPTKVPTGAQFTAPPQGAARSRLDLRARTSQSPRRCQQSRSWQLPPQGDARQEDAGTGGRREEGGGGGVGGRTRKQCSIQNEYPTRGGIGKSRDGRFF